MADYQLKKYCLDNGYVNEVRDLLRDDFYADDKHMTQEKIQDWIEEHDYTVYRECLRLIDSYKKRSGRLWKYISGMMNSGKCCVFLTFTFSDLALSESTFADRRRWVRRFLKDQCEYYIANIDFGDKLKNEHSEEREHYHAVAIGRVNMNAWTHGFMFAETVKKSGDIVKDVETSKKLSKYVSKLTNHAIKKSTGNFRLIYSRNCKDLLKYTSSAEN